MKNTVMIPMNHRFVYDSKGSPVWWQWCMETLGPSNNSQWGIPASQHYWRLEPSGAAMWFANPAHATLFALRWA